MATSADKGHLLLFMLYKDIDVFSGTTAALWCSRITTDTDEDAAKLHLWLHNAAAVVVQHEQMRTCADGPVFGRYIAGFMSVF